MTKYTGLIKTATSLVFSSRLYIVLGTGSFVVFLVLYAFVLPATYTGGRVGLVSLRLLNFKLSLFAFLFAAALALIVPFTVYGWRRRVNKNTATAAGSFVGSILPPLLCCSPLLPTAAALAGGIFPFAFGLAGFLQGLIATYETYIYLAIFFILALSVFLNAKQVVAALKQRCD